MINLRKIRLEKGYTQVQVAKELGISKQVYNNYELGKREADYETLLKLAEYFDTTVDSLLSDRNSVNSLNEINIDPDETDQDLIILNRNAKKLSVDKRKKLLEMAKVMFKEEFDD